MNAVAAQYTEVLSKSFALTTLVADRDRILTVSGSGRRELADRSISQPLEKLMDGRRLYQSEGIAEKCILPCEGSPRWCCAPHPSLRRAMDRRGGPADRRPHGHAGCRPAQGRECGSGISGKADGRVDTAARPVKQAGGCK